MADNWTGRDGNIAPVTFAAKEITGGVKLPQSTPSDAAGNPYAPANPLPVTRSGVKDSTGAIFWPDDCATSGVTRDAAGNLLTTTITDGTTSWRQTITRDAAGLLATVSRWVRL